MTRDELIPAVKPQQGASVVSCHVQPNASKTAVVGMYGEELKVSLKTPPVDGKANKELCRFFAGEFNLSAGRVQLLSGQTSRRKRVLIPVDREVFLRKYSS